MKMYLLYYVHHHINTQRTFMISPLMNGSSAAGSNFSSGSLNEEPDTTPDNARGNTPLPPGALCINAFNAVVRSGEDISDHGESKRKES
jgi:hypothetical protein